MSPLDDTGAINWLREDIGAIREHTAETRETMAALSVSVTALGARLEQHCADQVAHGRGASIAPGARAGRVPAWVLRIGPLLLAAALGLLGLGAYLGSGGDDDATVRAVRSVTDATERLGRELAELRSAVDTGGE